MIIHYLREGAEEYFTFGGIAGGFELGATEQPMQQVGFPGVEGVSMILDENKDTPIRCRYTLHGYANAQLLHNAINEMTRYAGKLHGYLVRTTGSTVTIPRCTFRGFQPEGPLRFVNGTSPGWLQQGFLHWTRRRL